MSLFSSAVTTPTLDTLCLLDYLKDKSVTVAHASVCLLLLYHYTQVTVGPHSSADVSVIFNPSALGLGEHVTELAFISQQVVHHASLWLPQL